MRYVSGYGAGHAAGHDRPDSPIRGSNEAGQAQFQILHTGVPEFKLNLGGCVEAAWIRCRYQADKSCQKQYVGRS